MGFPIGVTMADFPYQIDGAKKIVFERSKRAKHINISIKPYKGVRVAVPFGTSLGQAKAFAYSKRAWIQKHVEKIEQMEREHRHLSRQFVEIDRDEAREILCQRLDELAKTHGFSYNRVTIRNQKTRWGSCSHNNHISLNVKLVRLPESLMDYIIVHELVHTRFKNHGKQFYNELERIVGCRKPYEVALKKYSVGLL